MFCGREKYELSRAYNYMAPLPLYETQREDMPQVCVPFVMEDEEQTLYALMREGSSGED